jgi:hypothetical protein
MKRQRWIMHKKHTLKRGNWGASTPHCQHPQEKSQERTDALDRVWCRGGSVRGEWVGNGSRASSPFFIFAFSFAFSFCIFDCGQFHLDERVITCHVFDVVMTNKFQNFFLGFFYVHSTCLILIMPQS